MNVSAYLKCDQHGVFQVNVWWQTYFDVSVSDFTRHHKWAVLVSPSSLLEYWVKSVGADVASIVTVPAERITVETLYSTIYYSKYFIELNFDKSTQYVALWTHKRHPIPRPFGRAMECLLWVFHWNWPCYKGFLLYHEDPRAWKHFPYYCTFMNGTHRLLVVLLTKKSVVFSLSRWAWTNCRVVGDGIWLTDWLFDVHVRSL